ncbi:5-methylcytosine-specific restriction enzyme A [Tenacibaculum sp. 190524A02b]|uniref:5-methylcytosine-specific restriction enzyme A n=1 Tax=Tenacibaculum vairaonense TaxID=3137860 RepID=A0ABP1F5F8_9FLAO
MKLINFDNDKRFVQLLKKMGAKLQPMNLGVEWQSIDDEKLKELLETGEVEVDISELEFNNGVLEYKGRKVLVYIRDQYKKYYDKGYKYHLSNCSTITKNIKSNRKSRYVISQRTDGVFKINLLEDNIVVKKDLYEPLTVCKNCLTKLNYKGYAELSYSKKMNVFNTFSLDEYFDKSNETILSTLGFREEINTPVNVYSDNFAELSLAYRENKRFVCEECSINLSDNKKYLHVHHIDGDKSNNKESNLKALCIECHAKQPNHEWLKFNPDYIKFLEVKVKDIF